MSQGQEKYGDVKFEEAMELAGYGKFNKFVVLLSGLTLATSMLVFLDVSFLLPAAECDLLLSSQDKGLLGSSSYFGFIAASHLTGFVADTLGRRYILVRSLMLNFIIYILGSVAPNFWTIFVLKVISGVTTCPTIVALFPLLGEFVPAKRRSQSILFANAISALGMLYSSAVAWATLQAQWELNLWIVVFKPWRLFYLLCGVPSLLCAVLFYLIPESPKFLLTKGKRRDTLRILQTVHSVNSGKDQTSYPVLSVSLDADEKLPPDHHLGFIGMLKNICNQTLPLFKPPYLKDLVLCIILMFTSVSCITTIYLWLPEVTNRIAQYGDSGLGPENSCMCQMVARNTTIVRVTNTSGLVVCQTTIDTAVFLPNLLLTAANPTFLITTSLIVNLMDRRLFIMASLVVGSVLTFCITRVPSAAAIIIMFGSVAITGSISFNVLTSILIEVFPTYLRAMAVSLGIICGRVGSIVGAQLFSYLMDSRCSLLFHIISAFLLCCALAPFGFKLKKNEPHQSTKDAVAK